MKCFIAQDPQQGGIEGQLLFGYSPLDKDSSTSKIHSTEIGFGTFVIWKEGAKTVKQDAIRFENDRCNRIFAKNSIPRRHCAPDIRLTSGEPKDLSLLLSWKVLVIFDLTHS